MTESFDDYEMYEPVGDDFVQPSEFGKDHWSTLLFLESRAVDYKGIIANEKMRPGPRMHREFTTAAQLRMPGEYPTRLAGGRELRNHDDWSCAEDMAAASYIELMFRRKNDNAFDNTEAKVVLTERGWDMCTQIKKHKASGGTYATFAPFAL